MQNVRLGHYGYVGDGAEVETFSNCKNLLKQFYVIPMLFPHSGNLASLTYEARRNLAEKNQMILLIKFYLMKLCHFQMENGRLFFLFFFGFLNINVSIGSRNGLVPNDTKVIPCSI